MILKPIRPYNYYSVSMARAIYETIYRALYEPLESIFKKEIRNSLDLAKGKPNLIYQGIPIVIEDRRGTYRHVHNYEQYIDHDYGYISGTIGADGAELDCYVLRECTSDHFFVVTQVNPYDLQFDELKVFFGFQTIEEAEKAYHLNYNPGWKGFKKIDGYPQKDFWKWYATTKDLQDIGNPEDLQFHELHHAKSYLEEALRSGRLQYVDGAFVGHLNVALSKELRAIGAQYNKVRKAYTLETAKIPPHILGAIATGMQRQKDKLDQVRNFLKVIEERNIEKVDMEGIFDDIIKSLDKQFHVSTRVVTGRDLEIPLEQHLRPALRDAYTQNLDYYIQKFYTDEVLALRKKVERNVNEGFRAERLVDDILRQKQMSRRHARFIAKQEVSLMTSAYTKARYEDIGINEYIWSTSLDERVRPTAGTKGSARFNNHRILQGRKFRFDQPPIVDIATGKRANPGQDFGCRCVAVPFVSRGVNMIEPKPDLAMVM